MKNNLSGIFNLKTIIITVSSVISTAICIRLNITAKFPDFLIGIAIVFPVVFSISSAFGRREFALQRLSEFKGHLISLYFAAKDWPTDKANNHLHKKVANEIKEIMTLLKLMLKDKNTWKENEKKMYWHFGNISFQISEMRQLGVQSGEISRVNQYVSKIIIAFDNLRFICMYRTPFSLRAFSKVFIFSFPVLYAPYFAAISKDYSFQLIYIMPVLYSLILMSLHNVQENLENPFDGKGSDDVFINLEEELNMLEK